MSASGTRCNTSNDNEYNNPKKKKKNSLTAALVGKNNSPGMVSTETHYKTTHKKVANWNLTVQTFSEECEERGEAQLIHTPPADSY